MTSGSLEHPLHATPVLDPLELMQTIQLSHCLSSDRVGFAWEQLSMLSFLLVSHYLGMVCDKFSVAEDHCWIEFQV